MDHFMSKFDCKCLIRKDEKKIYQLLMFHSMPKFGLVSLFNGISSCLVCVQQGYYLTHCREDKGFMPFPKVLIRK